MVQSLFGLLCLQLHVGDFFPDLEHFSLMVLDEGGETRLPKALLTAQLGLGTRLHGREKGSLMS